MAQQPQPTYVVCNADESKPLVFGAAGTFVPAALLDVPLDYASAAQGVMLGAGAFLICDHSVSALLMLRELRHFFAVEACGKCTPCRIVQVGQGVWAGTPMPLVIPCYSKEIPSMHASAPPTGSMLDAYTPREIAHRVEALGVTKTRSDAVTVLVLAVLAGAFIALGALFFIVVITHSQSGFGMTRLVGGIAFSLGLILVIIGGAELFTGNNLVAMAWASRRITSRELWRHWGLVYLGNTIGALGTVGLVLLGQVHQLGEGAVGATALAIARHKAALGFIEAMALGVLCNALVCLAVWLAMGGRTVTDKVMAIVFPITAFVTMGLEHSIANMFFLPYACVLGGIHDAPFVAGALRNLGAVTLGNLAGGTLLVAGVYWLAYLRPSRRTAGMGEEPPHSG